MVCRDYPVVSVNQPVVFFRNCTTTVCEVIPKISEPIHRFMLSKRDKVRVAMYVEIKQNKINMN